VIVDGELDATERRRFYHGDLRGLGIKPKRQFAQDL
jgi:hypothetical protein